MTLLKWAVTVCLRVSSFTPFLQLSGRLHEIWDPAVLLLSLASDFFLSWWLSCDKYSLSVKYKRYQVWMRVGIRLLSYEVQCAALSHRSLRVQGHVLWQLHVLWRRQERGQLNASLVPRRFYRQGVEASNQSMWDNGWRREDALNAHDKRKAEHHRKQFAEHGSQRHEVQD